MNPVSVFGSIQTELSKSYNLPFAVTVCVKALTVVHWFWWFRRKKEMLKPENIVPAMVGTGLDVAIKFTPKAIEQTLRGIAKLILLATRIDECREKLQSLASSFRDFKNACIGKFLPYVEPQWVKVTDSMAFSAKTLNTWRERQNNFKSRMKRIFFCLINIFKKIFKLGMHVWDVYHAIIFSHDDMPEVIVNGMKWWRKIHNNKAYFYEKLQEYEPLIQKIFNATKVPPKLTAHRLIKKTTRIFDKIDSGLEKFDKFNKATGEKIITAAKKAKDAVKNFFLNIKSKKLLKGVEKPPVHTPFTLRGLPEIHWAGKPNFKTSSAVA